MLIETFTNGRLQAVEAGTDKAALVNLTGLGAYTERVLAGKVFGASTQTGVVTTVTLSATVTGLTLSNPVASGKNLVVLKFRGCIMTAPGATAPLGLALQKFHTSAVVHSTPLTLFNALGGSTTVGVGLADSSATLPAVPVCVWPITSIIAVSAITPTNIREDIDGMIVLTEGTSLSTFSLTTALSGIWAIYWTELDA